MTSNFTLFYTFAKIGLFTFGGGYSMLPLLERECVDNHKWTTEEEMLNYYAIGQCTPGIIAVNTATFIGYKEKGVWGGVCATAGVVFPSLVIITLLASVFSMMSESVYFQNAFSGIRLVVCALITNSVIKLSKKAVNSLLTVLVSVFALFFQLFLKISPIFAVVLTIIIGLLSFYVGNNNKNDLY